jgi:uncharacterized protein (UPF0218 family)
MFNHFLDVDSDMTESKITSIGQLMTEKLETIGLSSSIQQASTKMRRTTKRNIIVIRAPRKCIITYSSSQAQIKFS